ncbi:hypothetical protein Trydic_g8713 [Trypoxylus dichotomus]
MPGDGAAVEGHVETIKAAARFNGGEKFSSPPTKSGAAGKAMRRRKFLRTIAAGKIVINSVLSAIKRAIGYLMGCVANLYWFLY